MSNNPKASGGRAASATLRGDHTRDRLLDALESVAADEGLEALSHRVIARRARLHTGLIHYHFGTVERLLEEALARRATRLGQAQHAGLSALVARGRWSVEDVVAALWRPFSTIGAALDGGWNNYLCLVARLASDARGEALIERHFRDVGNAAHHALRATLPLASERALADGLRFVRSLFERESLARCCRDRSSARARTDDAQLVAFAAGGLRAIAGNSIEASGTLRAAVF
jgi:AcrR family transcriptional regulator